MKSARILFLIIISYVAHLPLFAQKATSPDSLIYYINRIQSAKDTANLDKTFYWIYKSSAPTLLNDTTTVDIMSLEKKLNAEDFIDLKSVYFSRLIQINTPAANEKVIYLVKNFIDGFKNNSSKYNYNRFLETLRELRLPYRNSGKISELIAYFSELNKRYQTMNDSAAISIVNNVLASLNKQMEELFF